MRWVPGQLVWGKHDGKEFWQIGAIRDPEDYNLGFRMRKAVVLWLASKDVSKVAEDSLLEFCQEFSQCSENTNSKNRRILERIVKEFAGSLGKTVTSEDWHSFATRTLTDYCSFGLASEWLTEDLSRAKEPTTPSSSSCQIAIETASPDVGEECRNGASTSFQKGQMVWIDLQEGDWWPAVLLAPEPGEVAILSSPPILISSAGAPLKDFFVNFAKNYQVEKSNFNMDYKLAVARAIKLIRTTVEPEVSIEGQGDASIIWAYENLEQYQGRILGASEMATVSQRATSPSSFALSATNGRKRPAGSDPIFNEPKKQKSADFKKYSGGLTTPKKPYVPRKRGEEGSIEDWIKALDAGWKRELVYRSTGEARAKDVYYWPPNGKKKLRSKREIARYLEDNAIRDLTEANFTFGGVDIQHQNNSVRDAAGWTVGPRKSSAANTSATVEISFAEGGTDLGAPPIPIMAVVNPPTNETESGNDTVDLEPPPL